MVAVQYQSQELTNYLSFSTHTCNSDSNPIQQWHTKRRNSDFPESAGGNLSAVCVWADQIRRWSEYRWTGPLHFIDTPDNACSFLYKRDCRNSAGQSHMCVAGAIRNYTTQLATFRKQGSQSSHNLTEALLFLSHFVGDIHQPMHVGFTSDAGGNTIKLRWYRRKSNLHHVWDKEIIVTALAAYYDKDTRLLLADIQNNLTQGIWSDDVPTWNHCDDVNSCINKWAEESINLACKWGYEGVKAGITLSAKYFDSRLPIVTERLAQGGVRLAMLLNRVFSEDGGFVASTSLIRLRLAMLLNQISEDDKERFVGST